MILNQKLSMTFNQGGIWAHLITIHDRKRNIYGLGKEIYITWPEIQCALVKDGSESKLDFFCISGTLLVIWIWISPLLTPCRGIHLSDLWFGGNLWYSTTQSPILDVGSKALWSFTFKTKGLPSSGNSKVWFHRGFRVL